MVGMGHIHHCCFQPDSSTWSSLFLRTSAACLSWKTWRGEKSNLFLIPPAQGGSWWWPVYIMHLILMQNSFHSATIFKGCKPGEVSSTRPASGMLDTYILLMLWSSVFYLIQPYSPQHLTEFNFKGPHREVPIAA